MADLRDPDTVFQIGVEPIRIDVLSSISGVDFDLAWQRRQETKYGDVPVFVIGREDYIANKEASGRPGDLRDIESLLDES